MSSASGTPLASTGADARSSSRWLGLALVALLVAELIVITARFDRRSLENAPRWWSDLPRLAVAAGTAILIVGIGGLPSRHELLENLGAARASRRWWAYGLFHLAAFGLFALQTEQVFRGGSRLTLHAVWLYAGWAAAGLATVVLWGMALARSDSLGPFQGSTRTAVVAALIGSVAWCAGAATSWLWRPLGRGTLAVSHALLTLVSREVIYLPDERIVGTPAFAALIEPRCSGYEGIGLVCGFLATYLYLFRAQLRFPHALLILPAGSLVIWLANAARIAALVAVGTWVSPEVAEKGFHSYAGWLSFCALALGMVAVLHRLPFFARPDGAIAGGGREAATDPTAAYVAPLLVLVATTMITAALSSGFDRLYPVRVLAVAATLRYCRGRHARPLWGGWSWHAVATGVVAFGVWMALEPAPSATGGGPLLGSGLAALPAGWAAAWLAFRVVGSVVTVPIAEELAFRGYLARFLVADDFESLPPRQLTWVSLLVSSALFGGLHGGRWLAGTAAGLLYAVALDRRGRLSDAVLAHATTNALIAAYAIGTGSWSLWA